MTMTVAIGTTLLFAIHFIFACWYLNCWFVMLFRCQSVRSYFSYAHSSSALFILANGVGVIMLVAWLLHLVTT